MSDPIEFTTIDLEAEQTEAEILRMSARGWSAYHAAAAIILAARRLEAALASRETIA
jgi:hypothetical protein